MEKTNLENILYEFFNKKPSLKTFIDIEPSKVYPWLCSGSIIYLKEYIDKLRELENDIKVFEFGAGLSTIWFSLNGCILNSVEHHSSWFNEVIKYFKKYNLFNVNLKLIQKDYYKEILNYPDNNFDIILIDGYEGSRIECCSASINKLKKGGILIVDDLNEIKNVGKIYTMLEDLDCLIYKMKARYRKNKPMKKTGIWKKI